jgi:hypothetical protein
MDPHILRINIINPDFWMVKSSSFGWLNPHKSICLVFFGAEIHKFPWALRHQRTPFPSKWQDLFDVEEEAQLSGFNTKNFIKQYCITCYLWLLMVSNC